MYSIIKLSNDVDILLQSTRVAIAAYLHDIGKFAQRAHPNTNELPNSLRDAIEAGKNTFCPLYNGKHTHIHAAWTGWAYDVLEDKKLIPNFRQPENAAPFSSRLNADTVENWQQRQAADNSLIRAAAAHHNPQTPLEWIIATADRVASGFERSHFDTYNATHDQEHVDVSQKHLSFKQQRLVTLFEQVNKGNDKEGIKACDLKYAYPLEVLNATTFAPKQNITPPNNQIAEKEYSDLWSKFTTALEAIPKAHQANLPLWFDHFDTCWHLHTHAIPSATNGNIKPDVSLFDHSRTAAALAVALWQYHTQHDTLSVEHIKADKDVRANDNWNTPKFELILGDFVGIQDFIFGAHGKSTHKFAAKLLRGRSVMVQLLSEVVALKLLEALNLPPTSQVLNAAGKFLIVAPATDATRKTIQAVRAEVDAWFLEQTYGQAGVIIAHTVASCDDLSHNNKNKNFNFNCKIAQLFQALEIQKRQRFDLCNNPNVIFKEYLQQTAKHGVCDIDGRLPAQVNQHGAWLSELVADQISVGEQLTQQAKILIANHQFEDKANCALMLDYFGYTIAIVNDTEFKKDSRQGIIRRMLDFSLPNADGNLWQGCAKRFINSYVARFEENDISLLDSKKYKNLDQDTISQAKEGAIKPLNVLACENRLQMDKENDTWQGQVALIAIKGDVDNLGAIFQQGLSKAEFSFAKWAGLSRQLNFFFATKLAYLCQNQFKNTYTVYAGGDDFFLLAPWKTAIELTSTIQSEFKQYVCNDEIHFSVGLPMFKPSVPIRHMADAAETALGQAKQVEGKNAVTLWGQSVGFDELRGLICNPRLTRILGDENIGDGFKYRLLNYADMAENKQKLIENNLWRSHLYYSVSRMDMVGDNDKKYLITDLVFLLDSLRSRLKIGLMYALYQKRN
jgi:CRISPR-associated protein Csm1